MSCLYIAPSEKSAERHIATALKSNLERLPRRTFLRAWCSVAWLYPGLHPDGYQCRDSGWPKELKPLAKEAFRRRRAGQLTDLELYPYPAAKARIQRERLASQKVICREISTPHPHNRRNACKTNRY